MRWSAPKRLAIAIAVCCSPITLLADSLVDAEPVTVASSSGRYEARVEPAADGLRITVWRKWVAGLRTEQWARAAYEHGPMFPSQVIVGDDEPSLVLRSAYVHRSSEDNQNVLAIFGASGLLLKRYRLSDLFSPDEIDRLPRTVSGRLWSESIHEGNQPGFLEFETPKPRPLPPGAFHAHEPVRVVFRINLRDGMVERVPPSAGTSEVPVSG